MERDEQFLQLCARLGELQLNPYESFPDIDLYMDQVLAYLSRQPATFRPDEKITPAMVNNYVKAGALSRANGKKYSPEHLVSLAIIARLKQVLSVKDVALLLQTDRGEESSEQYYNRFSETLSGTIAETVSSMSGASFSPPESLSQAAMRLAVESYVAKVACEYLIDQITEQKTQLSEEGKEKKSKPAKEKKTAKPNDDATIA